MKANFILLTMGCLLAVTGATVPSDNIKSRDPLPGRNTTIEVEKNLDKKDSILHVIYQKDNAIDNKVTELERQMYLLKKENKKIRKLLSDKNEEIKYIRETIGLQDFAESDLFVCLESDSLINNRSLIQKQKTGK